jgi:hypothetical protein
LDNTGNGWANKTLLRIGLKAVYDRIILADPVIKGSGE